MSYKFITKKQTFELMFVFYLYIITPFYLPSQTYPSSVKPIDKPRTLIVQKTKLRQ